MLAAARAAQGQAEVPPHLRRAWRYSRWGLGRPLDEMSARDVTIMQTLDHVYQTVRAFRAARNVTDLARANPEGWRLMSQLREMESESNG